MHYSAFILEKKYTCVKQTTDWHLKIFLVLSNPLYVNLINIPPISLHLFA
jgi:hypothetical protein